MRRMRAMDSRTFMYFLRSTNSAVIMLPTESSGYFRYWFMRLRVAGVALRMTRLTMFAGSSSIMSTASSTYMSSMMAASSVSVMELIMTSCSCASSSAKTSAPRSLESRRNTVAMRLLSSSPNSVRNSAISNSFISSSSSWRAFIRCASNSSRRCSRRSSLLFSSKPAHRSPS